MHEYKDSLKKVGVITKFGKVCDIIFNHHIQMNQGFKVITRLYKYIQASKWKPHHSVRNLDSRNEGWHDANSCVIHDVDMLFKSTLKVLEVGYYEPLLLKLFSKYLGIHRHPQMEDYCSLWREWIGNCRNHILKS